MKVQNISPLVNGFLQVKFDQATIDYLWKIIDIAKMENQVANNELAANIS